MCSEATGSSTTSFTEKEAYREGSKSLGMVWRAPFLLLQSSTSLICINKTAPCCFCRPRRYWRYARRKGPRWCWCCWHKITLTRLQWLSFGRTFCIFNLFMQLKSRTTLKHQSEPIQIIISGHIYGGGSTGTAQSPPLSPSSSPTGDQQSASGGSLSATSWPHLSTSCRFHKGPQSPRVSCRLPWKIWGTGKLYQQSGRLHIFPVLLL